MSARLTPTFTEDTKFFWDALTDHKLLIQRCAQCGALRHPPRPMCPTCRSLEWDTIEATGAASVFSFVLPKYPPLPWFDPDDHIVALVELDEGVRLVTNLVEVAPDAVSIGMRVVVRFVEFDDGLVLPLFAPAES